MVASVLELSCNTQGRDYVVDDIHGDYKTLKHALKQIEFDKSQDRLFMVGDLVDRGPDSPKALAFLSKPWVYAVRGNHEQMIINFHAKCGFHDSPWLKMFTRMKGRGWWRKLTPEQRKTHVEAYQNLPIAMEVEEANGYRIGILHAEVPCGMEWEAFKEAIRAGDSKTSKSALWGRKRIKSGDISGVRGIHRIFCGHTPLNHSIELGNIAYLDTGSVFRALRKSSSAHLSIAALSAHSDIRTLNRSMSSSRVHVFA
jgi:serine/threonine protein phosphatase 1